MSVKIAINGFGRIGRLAFRQMFGAEEYEIVAINDLTDAEQLAYLLKYDTNHRRYTKNVTYDEEHIIIDGKKIKIFALNSNKELAQEIADHIGVPLSECTVNRFSDGEVQVNIDETVRGHSVFVVQSTNCPVNEHYMELLIMIDALKRASASSE